MHIHIRLCNLTSYPLRLLSQPPVHSYSALESDGGPQDWNSVYLDPAGSEGRGLGFSGLADDNVRQRQFTHVALCSLLPLQYAYDVHAIGCMSYSQHDFPEGQQEVSSLVSDSW